MDTAGQGVAGIRRTEVPVVAVEGRSGLADSAGAGVPQGAGVPVVAGADVRRVETPALGITGIIGAGVSVVTVEGSRGDAGPSGTHVPSRAGVQVIARGRVVRGDTAGHRVAGIRRTEIAVIAVQEPPVGTDPVLTLVPGGAGVSIGATCGVVRVSAGSILIAGIVGAGVPVIAVQGWTRDAESVLTGVVEGAGIAVGAGAGDDIVVAAASGQTDVLGAGIVVVAVEGSDAEALTPLADVPGGASVLIVTGEGVVPVDTARVRRAGIDSADIAVVTDQGIPTLAGAATTLIPDGARVQVVARGGVVLVGAAPGGCTGIRGADIPVVTDHGLAGCAEAGAADVVHGAGVPIIAGVGVREVQAPSRRIAGVVSAGVPVVAIRLDTTDADTTATLVPHRAVVTVRAGRRVGQVQAAPRWGTRVIGADIVVMAIHGAPRLAEASAADIARRARIEVVTGRIVGCVGAPAIWVTGVVGADVSIVAIQRVAGLTG